MTHSLGRSNLVSILTVVLLLVIAAPVTSFGKDRGRRGRGRHSDNWKCGKFINCHDARDGRRDGRGPNRDFSRWDWRDRWRDDDRWRRDRWRDRRSGDSRWSDGRFRDGRFRRSGWRTRTVDDRSRDGRFRNDDWRDRFIRRVQFRDRWR